VVALDLGMHAVEDGAGMRLPRPKPHVLLAELLELRVDRDRLKLLREGNLLELHLVHRALSRAEQHSCGQQSTLHVGRLVRLTIGKKGKKKKECEATGCNNRDERIPRRW